jgi:cell division protein ZapB
METELKSLEGKLGQFIELCQKLRADNQELRQQLASAVNESKRLEEKITTATTRLESLLTQLPDDDA